MNFDCKTFIEQAISDIGDNYLVFIVFNETNISSCFNVKLSTGKLHEFFNIMVYMKKYINASSLVSIFILICVISTVNNITTEVSIKSP